MSEMLHVIVIDTLHTYAKLLGEMAGGFLGKLLEQCLELAVRSRMSNAGFQFYEGLILDVGVISDLQREVNIGTPPGEARRHNTHNRVVLVDKLERTA